MVKNLIIWCSVHYNYAFVASPDYTAEPLYSSHPWGTTCWPLYLFRSYFVHKLLSWDLDSWPLYRGGLYSGVAVKIEGFH